MKREDVLRMGKGNYRVKGHDSFDNLTEEEMLQLADIIIEIESEFEGLTEDEMEERRELAKKEAEEHFERINAQDEKDRKKAELEEFIKKEVRNHIASKLEKELREKYDCVGTKDTLVAQGLIAKVNYTKDAVEYEGIVDGKRIKFTAKDNGHFDIHKMEEIDYKSMVEDILNKSNEVV